MKRLAFLLLALSLTFALVGCSKTYSNADELLEKVREEIPLAEADTIEMQFAGMSTKGDYAMFWYISGNEYQMHRYFPVECEIIGESEYKFSHLYESMERCSEVGVVSWKNGLAFCVNNPECHTIRITDNSGTHDVTIENGAYPYVFYNELPASEYVFLDADGNEID